MAEPLPATELHVLLIGNYAHDEQESMQRFAAMMRQGLTEAGVQVELLAARPVFGKLKRSGSGVGKWLGYLDKFCLFPLLLKQRLRRLRKTAAQTRLIVHICDHSNAFYTKSLRGVPHLVTCHDLLAVRSALGEIEQNQTRWSGRLLQAIILNGLNRAQQVIAISEATRQDVLRLTTLKAEQVSTIPVALNYPYSPMPLPEACNRLAAIAARHAVPLEAAEGHYLFHVGGNQWYKNRMGVLRIYSQLVAGHPAPPLLLMAGKPFTAEMEHYVADNGLTGRVFSLQGCDNENLRALYTLADALLFPSLAEGFGWPVIEAQACGCPVVCGDRAPFPEVAGEGAVLYDPADETAFAQSLQKLLADPAELQRLREKGLQNAARFQPATMIACYLDAYQQLA